MKSIRCLLFAAASTCAAIACVSPQQMNPDGSAIKDSPSPTTPRLFDCQGENQTSAGNTREDCLPNTGDEAARDTEVGSGATEIHP